MKEIYRSFEGKLTPVEQESGYIISEYEDMFQVDQVSIEQGHDTSFRVPKEFLPKEQFDNLDKIGQLDVGTTNGCVPGGQTFYKGKWYSDEAIHRIQKSNQDNNWRKYVR